MNLAKGKNHRFVVTNILRRKKSGRALYENTYCARGDMENRIKEHQTQLFSTRTRPHRMESNQLRLWWSSVSYTLMNLLREYGLKDTELESAYFSTIRNKLLKIGARVKVSRRRVRISCSNSFPFKKLFQRVFKIFALKTWRLMAQSVFSHRRPCAGGANDSPLRKRRKRRPIEPSTDPVPVEATY